MELFYGGGGRSNPDFIHKVRVSRKRAGDVSPLMKWCDDYPTGDKGYFKRYYIDWRGGTKSYDTDYTIFQFEWEEPAIMFALSFADSVC